MGKEILWKGEESRSLTLSRPCSCGCDQRSSNHGVGYLTGSHPDGSGFTIWIKKEKLYQLLRGFYPEYKKPFCASEIPELQNKSQSCDIPCPHSVFEPHRCSLTKGHGGPCNWVSELKFS